MNFTRAGKRAARNRVVGWRRVSDLFVHRRTFHFFFGGAAARRLPDRPSLRRYEPDQVRRDSRTVAISALFIQGAPGTLQVCAASGRSQATNTGRTPVRDLALGPPLGSNAAGWGEKCRKGNRAGHTSQRRTASPTR